MRNENELNKTTFSRSPNRGCLRLCIAIALLWGTRAAAQAVQYAEKFPGNDAGSKIAACISALPPAGGVCDARQLGGTQRSAAGFTVGTPTKAVELLLGAVDLWVSKTIYVQARSSIVGLPSGQGIGVYQGPTMIKAADNSKLPVVVEVVGGLGILQDITVDGNRKNNPGAGVAIRVSSANRTSMFRVTAQNAAKDGIAIYSRRASESCCAKLQQIMSVDNGGSGLSIEATGDIFASLSEFEGNEKHGIDVFGSAGVRIEHSDIGGNHEYGIYLHGTSKLPSGNEIVIGNQFGTNYKADIYIQGANGASTGNLIAMNEFLGGDRREPGKADAITIMDSGANVLASNSFFAARGHHYRSCISISGSHGKPDQVNNNYCQAAEVGGESAFIVNASTQVIGNYGKVQTR